MISRNFSLFVARRSKRFLLSGLFANSHRLRPLSSQYPPFPEITKHPKHTALEKTEQTDRASAEAEYHVVLIWFRGMDEIVWLASAGFRTKPEGMLPPTIRNFPIGNFQAPRVRNGSMYSNRYSNQHTKSSVKPLKARGLASILHTVWRCVSISLAHLLFFLNQFNSFSDIISAPFSPTSWE